MGETVHKVCLLGTFAVGKTSLVRRFVTNVFDGTYQSTVGVTIQTKSLVLESGRSLKLVIWDLSGEARFERMRADYLRGASGFLVVADGTRIATLTTALELRDELLHRNGPLPHAGLVNKSDQDELWQVDPEYRDRLARDPQTPWRVTSARTGDQVEAAFRSLANQLMGATYPQLGQ